MISVRSLVVALFCRVPSSSYLYSAVSTPLSFWSAVGFLDFDLQHNSSFSALIALGVFPQTEQNLSLGRNTFPQVQTLLFESIWICLAPQNGHTIVPSGKVAEHLWQMIFMM
jgi:hypothetical protein